jgi:hypothetical protein
MEGLHNHHLSQGLKRNKAYLENLYLHIQIMSRNHFSLSSISSGISSTSSSFFSYPIILNLIEIDFLVNFWKFLHFLSSNSFNFWKMVLFGLFVCQSGRPVTPVVHTGQTGMSVFINRPKTLSLLNSFSNLSLSLPQRSLSSRLPPSGDLGSPPWKTQFHVGIWSSSPW